MKIPAAPLFLAYKNRLAESLVWLTIMTLACLLAWSLARWSWLWFAPLPVAASANAFPVGSLAERIDRARIFGAQRAAEVAFSAKLKGVYAGSMQRQSFALIETEGRVRAVVPGEALAPGVVLDEIRADYVVVSHGGTKERLVFQGRAASGGE